MLLELNYNYKATHCSRHLYIYIKHLRRIVVIHLATYWAKKVCLQANLIINKVESKGQTLHL